VTISNLVFAASLRLRASLFFAATTLSPGERRKHQ
jgi:hypothetical protein